MENDNVPLPVLDGKKYAKWRLRIQCILEVKALDKVVYGNVKEDIETEDYVKKNARAKMLLVNAVGDKHSTIIMPCKTARDIWSRLESEYSASHEL